MACRLTYHDKLYHSDSIGDGELDKIKRQLRKPLFCSVYLIAPAAGSRDLLEFFHSRQLAQPYFQRRRIYVLGIAKTYGEAVLLVQRIVQDCLDARGDCAVLEYLNASEWRATCWESS